MIWTTEKELKTWRKMVDGFTHNLLFGKDEDHKSVEQEERFCWAYIVVGGEEVLTWVRYPDKLVARKTKDVYSMSKEEYDDFEFVRWARLMDL